jgi:DNA-binding NtrC family response regulator
MVDETSAVAERAREVFSSSHVKPEFATSLDDLPLVFEASGVPELLIVNVTGATTPRALSASLQHTKYGGRLLAFVDSLADPGVGRLAGRPGAECRMRPESTASLDEALRAVLERIQRASRAASEPAPVASHTFHGIVGSSPKMLDVFSRIEKVASGDANVCIYGESGTGKELIARAIHYLSPRRDRPLVTVDCTTIPEGLMESQLFGHVRGAFTGAVEHRQGVFSLAHTGTIFIDELCELGMPLQAKFLRVIQNREFVRVGGSKPIRTDVRLVTATNKDPKRQVERGEFREDLYYRVAVCVIHVPPLRERREDIPLLVDHFLAKFAAVYGRPLCGIEPAAMKRLMVAPWPGNVRQLENVLEQAFVMAEGRSLTERDIVTNDLDESSAASLTAGAIYEAGLPLREVERRHILRTLQKVNGSRSEASRLLGISVRCLQYKLKEYGVATASALA